MEITNPDLLELASYLEQNPTQHQLPELPSSTQYLELGSAVSYLTKPETIITSRDLHQRILRDFKKSKETVRSDSKPSTKPFAHSKLVANPLPDTIFKPMTPEATNRPLPPNLQKLQDVCQLELECLPCPGDELHTFMYAVTVALYPEILTYQQPERHRCWKKIRSRMAFDLDDQDLYAKFSYRNVFRKTVGQDELFGDRPISSTWFRRYLADYFDVNVIVIYKNLIINSSPLRFRTTLICHYDNDGLSLLTHSDGTSFFDYDVVSKLLESGWKTIDGLWAAGRYKIKELQEIAVALTLPITCKGNNSNVRNIVKNVLYQEISNQLAWLE